MPEFAPFALWTISSIEPELAKRLQSPFVSLGRWRNRQKMLAGLAVLPSVENGVVFCDKVAGFVQFARKKDTVSTVDFRFSLQRRAHHAVAAYPRLENRAASFP